MQHKYTMTISRLTVDKLGVKLYDRVSAVIAELIANSYDADATEVTVRAPMGELLATKAGAKITDKNYSIEVEDNGTGMTPDEVNNFYLVVGAERRNDPKRGDVSRQFKRKVMGRKGVGKLAPFGVCKQIEIISSGGERIKGKDKNGAPAEGFITAHLVLKRSQILSDTEKEYNPEVGALDGVVQPRCGTILRLTDFEHRLVPNIDDFERQLSQRFGVASQNWKINLIDALKTEDDPNQSRTVGDFSVMKMDNTEVRFKSGATLVPAVGPGGAQFADMLSGFQLDGKTYPVTGWVAYAKQPYKDELMAGVRIYCRGKIAAQTHIFNMKAGFTGEYDIRSYLIGELHADWLDESEDLIRTDRQDILWSHELGREFERWGQALVKKIGTLTREPRKKRAWQSFEEASDITGKIGELFPGDDQKEIRENTLEIAKTVAQTAREDELEDPEFVDSVVNLSLLLGPHITLDKKLREAADSKDSPMTVITGILRTARIAELASFGKIADDRIKVIERVEKLKDNPDTLESVFQDLIEEAPWLINPQWAPITANVSFTTFKSEFAKYYKKETGEDLVLDHFEGSNKRADFIMSNQENTVQIIEIKQPGHKLQNGEMERIQNYNDIMERFLNADGHGDFKSLYGNFKITLVCDGLALTTVHKSAFGKFKDDGKLEQITWTVFLRRTRKMHEDFLKEAERQKKIATAK